MFVITVSLLAGFCGFYLTYVFIWVAYQRHRHGCRRASRYSQKVPYIGSDVYKTMNTSKYGGHHMKFMQRQFETYGKTFEATIWGQPWIFTADTRVVRAINTTKSECFGVEPVRKKVNQGWIGNGMFISDGPKWKESRLLFKPLFVKTQVLPLPRFDAHLDNLFQVLPKDGRVVDLQPLFRRLYLDVAFDYLFGESANTLKPQDSGIDVEAFHSAFETASAGMSKRTSLGWALGASADDPKWRRACSYVHSIFDDYMDRAIAREQGLAEEPFKSEANNELHSASAEDTATIGISDVFFHLARYPKVWRELREEVLRSDVPLDPGSFSSLRYLQAVLHESLRLLSPVDVSFRTCIQDCVLPAGGGKDGNAPLYVQRGSRLESRIGVMHRDRQIWGEDAESFRPERWLKDSPKPEYIPFLEGGRTCPSQQMTMIQYAWILIRSAQQYEAVYNRDDVFEFIEDIKFGKQSKNGIQVSLKLSGAEARTEMKSCG